MGCLDLNFSLVGYHGMGLVDLSFVVVLCALGVGIFDCVIA